MEAADIFTASHELFGGIKIEREESEVDEGDVEAVIADIEDAIPVSSESENPAKKGKSNNLSRIS